ncbi:layilin isoform 4-T4 [Hipposideros larvatus]
MQLGAALQAVLLAVLLAEPGGATGRLLSASDLDLRGGQPVCRGGTQRPCYKVIYFHDASRRLNFEEARAACRRDGGQLVSIESEDEQRLIEKFIENLLASDGDFWIGLRRREEKQSNSTACQDLYVWTDGSTSTFRNWYVDEPSCGSEICVVMYHQPSAPTGIGGPYMFQWNDDRCNMKNNFICKYSDENPTAPSTGPGGEGTEPATPILPGDIEKEEAKEIFKENKEDTNQDQPNEETHKVRPGRVPNGELLCLLSEESGCLIMLLTQHCVHQPESSIELWCAEVLLRYHYINMIDLIIGHVTELNL